MIDSHPDFQRKCVATSKKATFSQCICFAVSLLHTGSASLVQFLPVQFCFSCFNNLCQSLCLWLTLKPQEDKAVKFQRNLSKLQVTQGGLTQETSDRMWVSTKVPSELLTVGWCLVYCETPDCSPPTPNFCEAVTEMSLCAFLFCWQFWHSSNYEFPLISVAWKYAFYAKVTFSAWGLCTDLRIQGFWDKVTKCKAGYFIGLL